MMSWRWSSLLQTAFFDVQFAGIYMVSIPVLAI